MAIGYTPSQMDPSAGGGGSNWERNINNQDISTAKPVYNAATGQYEWQLPDGSRLTGNGAGQNGNSPYGPYAGGYQNDPDFMPPGSLQNNETWFGPGGGGSQGGSGGGNGSGLPLTALRGLAAIPAIARQLGGGNGSGNGNASMPPELQQLLAMAMQRMSQQEPLFQSINAQAMAGLPTAYQR